MDWTIAGLTFGFLGSFHCIGMCGPIALSLPGKFDFKFRFIISKLFYNSGRIATYSLMGLITGLFSKGVSLVGYQQGLSIFVGSLILLTILGNKLRDSLSRWKIYPTFISEKVTGKIRVLFSKNTINSHFLIGILNGFLPCGFVYMALATAVTTGSLENSVIFMLGFGLGTVPAMLSISLAGGFVSLSLRQKLQNLSPYFVGFVGIILILRGLNLGIPFLSPAL
jgi:sulfite exporter TauE/SafE